MSYNWHLPQTTKDGRRDVDSMRRLLIDFRPRWSIMRRFLSISTVQCCTLDYRGVVMSNCILLTQEGTTSLESLWGRSFIQLTVDNPEGAGSRWWGVSWFWMIYVEEIAVLTARISRNDDKVRVLRYFGFRWFCSSLLQAPTNSWHPLNARIYSHTDI